MAKILFHNGTIITMDPRCPRAREVLVEDGIILQVGEVLPADGQTIRRDLEGRTMLPGFIDSHSHFTAVARRLTMVPLQACSTKPQLLAALRQGQPIGGWLLAMGYDDLEFDRRDLDTISRDMPILCVHISGHIAMLNTCGLKELGYWGIFSPPVGGTVERLPDGTPSGRITEAAYLAPEIQVKLPSPDPQTMAQALEQAGQRYASFGITSCQDARVTRMEYGLLSGARPILDVVGQVVPEAADLLAHSDYVNHIRMGGYKIFLDGSLQGGTAWLSDSGSPALSDDVVTEAAKTCLKQGWQLNAHCNGDAACEQLIRCYSRAIDETGIHRDLRPVMVHAQTVRPDQLKRMALLGMTASFFLDHVYHWGDVYHDSLLGPERAAAISPLRTAQNLGIRATIHQDSPVVESNMLLSIHNAVNRRTKSGRLLGPQERVSVFDALQTVTTNAAWQIFEEHRKGSITPGKLADFVILHENPLTVDPARLKDIQILETIKEGKTIYKCT